MAGVTPDGFEQKTFEEIETEVGDDLRAAFGPQTNLLATSVFGQVVGIMSDKLAELWEVLAAVYRSQYPDSSSDEALDNVSAITGTLRDAAEPSTAVLDRISLDGGTTLLAGRIVSVGENGPRYRTTEDVTNAAGFQATVSVPAESEETGEITGFSGTIDTIVTPVSGWSAQAAETSGNAETYNLSGGETLTVKVDGEDTAQTVNFVGGDFAVGGAATAAEVAARIDSDLTGAGAFDAGGSVRIESDLDGSGSSIEVTGGTANTALGFGTDEIKGFNSLDVTLGNDIESDPDLRTRREEELRATGSATVEALRSKTLQVDDVDEAFVFENVTDSVDGDGVPAHAFEDVIRGPSAVDADVAAAIFANKAAGIQAHGSTVEVVTDSQGFTHNIGFSRATEVPIFLIITVTTNTDATAGPVYPVDGDTQVAAALAAFGDALGIGGDVIAEAIKCVAFDVSGVTDITAFTLGTAPAPAGTINIPIGSRSIATFDTSDITVNS